MIVFVIVNTYMGQTLEALATTEGLTAITNGFFKTGEMKFDSYFEQEGERKKEIIKNVNEKITLMLEIEPNEIGKGFLKEGRIVANGLDRSDVNFKFSKIKNVTVEELEDTVQYEEGNVVSGDEETIENETVEENSMIGEEKAKDEKIENEVSNHVENNRTENRVIENEIENNVRAENTVIENEIEENTIIENEILSQNMMNETIENDIEKNRISNEVTSRSSESREVIEGNLVQEELTEEKVVETQETYEELTAKDFEIELISDNEIKVQNVIYHTTIEVEIEFVKKEELNVEDLYQEINLKLNGTYINVNLEKIETEQESKIYVGWSDTQEFEISGEYTQFSPFKLGEHTGSIVQNKIKIKRESEDEKYLPIKETTIEIEVPEYNGKAPETVNVQCTKLMATKGEDLGEVNFGEENWKYDVEKKKIIITVSNEEKARFSEGEDEYVIVYRYQDYTEDEMITMPNRFRVTVEGYRSNNNEIQIKEFDDLQTVKTKINDLITYTIGSTEEAMNKAKINANYLTEEAPYQTEFTTTVNVNILTSDLLEEFKINSAKEKYIDKNAVEFDATQDVYYNKIKFNYNEIKSIISNGSAIEIQTVTGEILYRLEEQNITNQECCEIDLESKEKGICVVFKNIANNGNISIEFTKAIGKSSYKKAAFSNFEAIESYVSAELKYQNYEERYGMSEIATSKKMENSQTEAEIKLMNHNLNPVVKNDGVEVRIVLNNDKQTTDFYRNPSFELIFPKYVREVAVENINLIYGCGLEISQYEVYKEDNFVKMRIDLTGTQNVFSESVMTNGTNIILSLNVSLDEYTPKKQDQIKLYYCNEAVSNYRAETKWSIQKNIPSGILKETNGYDVATINYQGGEGLILANAMINYDGQASKINSIGQGEKTAEIKVYGKEQIAKMELVAMNNTKNECTDIVLLGRVPFEGNTSVISKKNLGSNITTKMISGIQESVQNPNMTTIYYSAKEDATKDLKEEANGWTTEVRDYSRVKSYMIVVKGNMKAGNVLRFSYDFEIPEGIGYDGEVYGSFGGNYNNRQEKVITYESTEADRVGLVTEVKPTNNNIANQPGLNMIVYPFGENDYLYYGQIATMVTKVANNTNQDISNATLKVSLPTGTVYTERDYTKTGKTGKEIYQNNTEIKEKEFVVKSLKVGEVKEFRFDVQILENDKDKTILEGYTQLNGVTQKYQWMARKGKMAVYTKLEDNNIVKYHEGSEIVYLVDIDKKSKEVLRDLRLSFKLPDCMQVSDIKVVNEDTERSVVYQTQDRITTAEIGQMNSDEKRIKVYCKIEGLNAENAIYETIFNVFEADQKTRLYTSNRGTIMTEKVFVEVKQSMNSNEFNYHDLFEYRLLIENKSEMETEISINNYIPDTIYFGESRIFIDGRQQEDVKLYNGFTRYETLSPKGKIEIVVTGAIIDWQGYNEQKEISNTAKVTLRKTGEEIISNEMNIKIHGDSNVKKGEMDFAEENNERILQQNNEANYSISGNVYVDSDKNGMKTEEDKTLKSQVQVQLQKGSQMIKATTTDSTGNYCFSGLEPGDYSISYNYDKENYTSAKYTQEQATKEVKTIEAEEGISVTDNITITDSSIENLNAGLQEKDKFDFEIKQYVDSAIVNIKGEEKEYNYDKLELAKIEIDPLDLKDAMVKLKYKIVVTNVGNQVGQITSIVDYIPNGMIFNQLENAEWTIGTMEGNIYYDGLKGIDILPGESQEISLILNKKMTEDNTGVVSNKVQIAYTESSTRLTEAIEGNFASQETIVTLTQGSHKGLTITIITISMTSVIGMFGYMIQTGKLDKKFNGKKWIKRVYK